MRTGSLYKCSERTTLRVERCERLVRQRGIAKMRMR